MFVIVLTQQKYLIYFDYTNNTDIKIRKIRNIY